MNEQIEILNSMILELRRGTMLLSVLSQLAEPQYGYYLVQKLEEKGVTIEPGTLYPLLRRLEKQGLLESNWDTNESRPRKYYLLSAAGQEIYTRLRAEWQGMVGHMEKMIHQEGGN
ncbi:MAG: PadR family transcriptional regulator [Bacillota bacterium]